VRAKSYHTSGTLPVERDLTAARAESAEIYEFISPNSAFSAVDGFGAPVAADFARQWDDAGFVRRFTGFWA
jgi:hypothetical protein